jgi:uncharacterized zinc-type alcohol dehydrogenase-like protein
MAISAYAAMDAGGKLSPFSYDRGDLGPHDVEVKVSHCGICHSDVHLVDNDWGMSSYPLVPGHEIVGTVVETGPHVTGLEKGQRVGIGWQRSACLQCEPCISGHENLCAQSQAVCMGNYGGFGDSVVCDSRFSFPVPEDLSSENAGPLLCGGITVYSPMRNYRVKASMKVGVVGIGGLGHFALQFAGAAGCEVTAFSHSPNKQKEAEALGAHHFVSSTDASALEASAGTMDYIVSTVFADLDWTAYLNVLKPNGNLVIVGAAKNPISFPAFPLIMGQRQISGSVIGSRAGIQEMLEFAARHQIEAEAEVMPMSQADEALAKVRNNQARYRVVLEA